MTLPGSRKDTKDRNVLRFCSLVTMSVLLSIPALRLIHPQNTGASAGTLLEPLPKTAAATIVFDDIPHGLPARQIRDKATPILGRLAQGHGTISMTEGVSHSAEGRRQTLWFVRTFAAAGDKEQRKDEVELRFDGDSGSLIYARSLCRKNRSVAASVRAVRGPEVVQAARVYLRKLGLAEGDGHLSSSNEPSVVFPPQLSKRGFWRVWLLGRDVPGGQALTVQVTLDAAANAYTCAAVAERSAFPRFSLPRRSPIPIVRATPFSPASRRGTVH